MHLCTPHAYILQALVYLLQINVRKELQIWSFRVTV